MQNAIFLLCCVLGTLYSSEVLGIPSLESMTLEEKVGQLLIAHFHGETVNEDARILIQDACVGGIIYYEWANGLHSPQQVQNLSNELQKLALMNRYPIALFISTDQEGGLVSQLKSGFTIFPGNSALGQTRDPHLAELCFYAMGKEMVAVGINVDFSPVVDVNCNPHNPVIGIRSFGDTADVVSLHAKSALIGFHQAHVIPTLKHFPGHGDVAFDSHEYIPVVNKSKDELLCVELYPYQQLLQNADMVMSAHVSVPALDPHQCATFSKRILQDLLRQEMGYQGIIISDSLVMEGLFANCSSIEEAALRAFNAGCDLLLLGGKQLLGQRLNYELTVKDVKRVHSFLIEAIKNDQISEKRVDESVQRILNLKNTYGLFGASFPAENEIVQYVNTQENQRLAAHVAHLSVAMVKNTLPESFPLNEKTIAVLFPSIVNELVRKSSLVTLGKETLKSRFTYQKPSEEEMKKCLSLAQIADVIVVCSYNAWQFPEQQALIQSILDTGHPSIVISLKDPLDKTLFPEAAALITTFSPTAFSLEAAVQRLKGR